MNHLFKTTRRVEFRDTDAAGIMHFTSILAFMEMAEHDFLRQIGVPLFDHSDPGTKVSWPRVSVRCDFQGPVRFEDQVEISVAIERLGRSSVTYAFNLTCSGKPVAKGNMTSVCCQFTNDGMKSVEIPDALIEKLSPYRTDVASNG